MSESIEYGELMRLLAEVLGVLDRLEIEVGDGTPGDLFGICADVTKLKAVLGFTPRYSPKDGVRQFVGWALDNVPVAPAD